MGLEGLISIRERPIERELGGGALNHARPDNLRLSLSSLLYLVPLRVHVGHSSWLVLLLFFACRAFNNGFEIVRRSIIDLGKSNRDGVHGRHKVLLGNGGVNP